jgi:hypothetical protein
METFYVNGSDDTPEITLDKDKGIFEIQGRSLPEDVIDFYAPVYSWLERYVTNPNEDTFVKVRIDYFNSASQRALNEIFTILSRLSFKGRRVMVEWHYQSEDEEMLESGREYADITKLPFLFKSYN